MTHRRAISFASGGVLLGFLLLTMGVGGFIGYITGGGDSPWYQALAKPAFNPPGALFGIVWPILYALMAVAAWLVWLEQDSPLRAKALGFFFAQLVVNYIWSPLFFTLHLIAPAAVWIALLVLLVAITMRLFWRIRPLCGVMLAPYLAWVSFALVLNSTIWFMNR